MPPGVPRDGERGHDRPCPTAPGNRGAQPGDVLTVTRLDRLARSTRDLLNTLAAITAKEVGFRTLADARADTTTAHGR
jgi:DNA invertase Pin-like site-specific DNA recombinase